MSSQLTTKQKEQLLTTYEQLTPKKLRKFSTLIWIIITLVADISGVIAQITLNEYKYLTSSVFLLLIGIILIPFSSYTRNQLLDLENSLPTFVQLSKQETQAWVIKQVRLAVSGNWVKWASGFFIIIVGVITIIFLGIPFQNNLLRILSVFGLMPLFFFCGTTAYNYACVALMPFEIGRMSIRVPLYQDSYSGISSINRIIYNLSSAGVGLYILLFLAIYTSPYKGGFVMYLWLSILGIGGLLLLPLAFGGLHRAMKNAKRIVLMQLAEKLETSIKESLINPTKEKLDVVQALFAFRKELADLPEWPIDFKTVATLSSTILIPLIGLILNVLTKKP